MHKINFMVKLDPSNTVNWDGDTIKSGNDKEIPAVYDGRNIAVPLYGLVLGFYGNGIKIISGMVIPNLYAN